MPILYRQPGLSIADFLPRIAVPLAMALTCNIGAAITFAAAEDVGSSSAASSALQVAKVPTLRPDELVGAWVARLRTEAEALRTEGAAPLVRALQEMTATEAALLERMRATPAIEALLLEAARVWADNSDNSDRLCRQLDRAPLVTAYHRQRLAAVRSVLAEAVEAGALPGAARPLPFPRHRPDDHVAIGTARVAVRAAPLCARGYARPVLAAAHTDLEGRIVHIWTNALFAGCQGKYFTSGTAGCLINIVELPA